MSGKAKRAAAEPSIHLIGAVCVDLIMGPVTPWPQPGTETFVDHSELRVGGPAGNTALALKALGARHHLACNIGDDMFGAWLAGAFGEAASGWARVAKPTAISVGIEHPGGERSFLTAPGNLAEQTIGGMLSMLPARAVTGDIALLTGAFLYPALLDGFDGLLATLGERGFVVALDTGWPPGGWDAATRARLGAWLGRCDHILLNEIECLSLSQTTSIEEAARWMSERTKPGAVIVIKRGADGASAWAGGNVVHAPAPAVTVIDTTGAGDAFNGGYLAACLGGATTVEALHEGVAIASAAIASSPREYRAPNRAALPAAS
jgi:sugar/nucleoside kinase (ribokinase family)